MADYKMRYTGDKYQHCSNKKCNKKQKFIRCTKCLGKVGPSTTCGRCRNTGYVCSAAPYDDHHLR